MHYYKGQWSQNKCPYKYRSDLVECLNKMYPGHSKKYWTQKKMPQLQAMWYHYKPKNNKGESTNEQA